MTAIKAIETVYKGYKFRSRLEARWAIFFDALTLQWEYEKEGYDLGDGLWYLPDFWLEDLKVWVEIKPNTVEHQEFFDHPEVWEAEDITWDKCRGLAQHTGNLVLLIHGNPWPDEYMIQDFRVIDPEDKEYGMTEGAWATCRKCDGVWIREYENQAYSLGPHTCDSDVGWPLTGAWSKRLMEAYTLARQFRFGSHGRG